MALKISTASIKSALRNANVEIAEYNEYSGRCNKAGATVQTVNRAYAHGKIQTASYVSWSQVARNVHRALTDEERAAWNAAVEAGLDRIRLALILAGYAVTRKQDTLGRAELIVTLP